MAEKTGIEWADATWNPWQGCHKISPGCKNCYMFRDLTRYGKDPDSPWRSSDATFRNPLRWAKNGLVPNGGRIFTCSYSDWFIEEADGWRDEAWEIIKATPQFTYLILTKRPERIAEHLPKDWGNGYPNVWLLVSTENQRYFDERWQILCGIPAVVRGISAEPLLGPLDISLAELLPDWAITGGESDPKPRPTNLDWVRSVRDFCQRANIPFFHKQHGGSKKIDGTWGGRILDGRTWDEFAQPSIRKDDEASPRF